MFSDARRSTPPRFVTRTLIATLVTVAFVLTAVLVIVTFIVRGHVRQAVVAKLETGQRLLATLEERRAEDLRMQVATLAESPTLKAALDTYEAERRTASQDVRTQLTETVARELEKLSARLKADVLAARNFEGEVIAISGRRAQDWAAEYRRDDAGMTDAAFLTLPSGVFRTMTVPIMLHDVELGSVQFAQALDEHYATGLSALSGARALIVSNDRVLATTLPSSLLAALTPATLETFSAGTLTMLAGEEFAVRPLLQESGAAVYVLDSVEASARPLIRASLQTMTGLAVGAFALAGLASLWLARTVSRPIGTLSRSLTEMTRTRRFDRPLPPSGASLEVDSLTDAFNTMMKSIEAAEAETLNAYLEAIRALALALDARDPYTSGHSERVSTLSVAIGRKMGLDTATLEVLRLGALLHDIGKIGISDNVLRKPSPLTPDEYDIIKTHPTVGSRILRSVRFLEPHLPVVEMHHERPDGQGYPYGLKGSAIPVLARIVHVADAYDAMTSARAYRPALPKATGLRELHRGAGTDFDAEVVRALDAVLAEGEAALRAHGVPAAEAPSPVRGSGGRRRAEVKPDPLEEFSSEGQIA